MAALSKIYTAGMFLTRIEQRCKNIENFDLERNRICQITKTNILTTFTDGNSALRRYYHTRENGTVANKEISIGSKNYFDVTGVTFGVTQPYIKCNSLEEFTAKQSPQAQESLVTGQYWYWLQGEDKILIFQGTGITGQGTLSVWHIRYPDLAMLTQDAWATDTAKVDLPDFIIPYTIISASIDCVREKGLAIPDSWNRDLSGAVGGISDKLIAGENAARKMYQDNLT